MTDKLEAAPDASAPSSKSMLEAATQMWLAGLGAFWLGPLVKAHDEGTRIVDILVKQAGRLQKPTADTAEKAEVHGHGSDTWDQLEQIFDDRIAHALARLNVPTHADLDALRDKVEALTAAVEKLSEHQGRTAKTGRAKTPA